MAYNFQNLVEPVNKTIGIAEKVYAAPLEWFDLIAQPSDDGNVITKPHILSGENDFFEMLLLPDKNSYGAKPAGDKGVQQLNHELKVFIPGIYAQALEQVANIINTPLIVLQGDCSLGAQYQLGNQRCYAWASAETMTGTTNNGMKGFALTIFYAGPVWIYSPDPNGVYVNGFELIFNDDFLIFNQ